MEQHEVDYKYALSLLERCNRLVEQDAGLQKLFLWNGGNFWQSYQAALFLDAKIWSKDKKLSQTRQRIIPFLKQIVASGFLALVSLISALYLCLSRKKILIFTEDRTEGAHKNDFRIEPLYSALEMESVGFLEVVHTLTDKRTFKNLFTRGRCVVYLESIDFIISPFVWLSKKSARRIIKNINLKQFPKDEQEFIAFELEKFISYRLITKVRIQVFTALMKLSGTKIAFSIDDTRHYSEFIAGAKRADVKSVAIQHGHFTKYHVGWLKKTNLPGEIIRSDSLIVWSQYWKAELVRLGTYFHPEEIIIGGEAHPVVPIPEVTGDKPAILFPYEQDAKKYEVRDFILTLLDLSTYEIIFKIREDKDELAQLAEYGLESRRDDITVVRIAHDVFRRVTLVVGTYSTFLYDCVAEERAVAILETSLDYGMAMVANGLADLISKKDNPEKKVEALLEISPEVLHARRVKLLGKETKDLASSLRAIIKKHV